MFFDHYQSDKFAIFPIVSIIENKLILYLKYINMEFRYTKNQVARGALPDTETYNQLILIKRCSCLYATYQIKLLTYLSREKHKKLVIEIKKDTKIHNSLKKFIEMNNEFVKIKRN
jgi:hypothetical protein